LDRQIREEIISCLEAGRASSATQLLASNRSTTVWAFGMRAASRTARTYDRRWVIAGAIVGDWLASIHPYDSTTVLGCIARACSIAGISDRDALLSVIADEIDAPGESALRNVAALHSLEELGIAEGTTASCGSCRRPANPGRLETRMTFPGTTADPSNGAPTPTVNESGAS
jgi:hypothetical protein